MANGATPFQAEAWAEYGIGTLVLFLRFFARWKVVGIKGWKGDDVFAFFVLVFWTVRFLLILSPSHGQHHLQCPNTNQHQSIRRKQQPSTTTTTTTASYPFSSCLPNN